MLFAFDTSVVCCDLCDGCIVVPHKCNPSACNPSECNPIAMLLRLVFVHVLQPMCIAMLLIAIMTGVSSVPTNTMVVDVGIVCMRCSRCALRCC